MGIKVVRQNDSLQCGASCLATICHYYGCAFPLQQISELCYGDKNGVSVGDILDASKALGLDANAGTTKIDELSKIQRPLIIHWNKNHFVVLYKVRKKRYYIADPAVGLISYNETDFVRSWTKSNYGDIDSGLVIDLYPTEFFPKIQPQKIDKMRFFSKFAHSFRWQMFLILLLLLVGNMLQAILPYLTQAVVDKGIGSQNVKLVWLILIGEVLIVFGKTVSEFFRRKIQLAVSLHMNMSMTNAFFLKMFKLPMNFFENRLVGDLMQRVSDHTRIQTFMTDYLISAIYSIVSFVIFCIVLFSYNSNIFMVFFGFTVVNFAWSIYVLNKRQSLDYALFNAQSKNQSIAFRMITNAQEIKLQRCESRRCEEWVESQKNLNAVKTKWLYFQQTIDGGSILWGEIKNVLITVIAATAVINGEITMGAMLAVQLVVGQLAAPTTQIVSSLFAIQDVKISLERISDIRMRKDENENRFGLVKDNLDINIKGMSFGYSKSYDSLVLNDINLKIPRGKMTAVVGHSGCGKTTLIKLLLGYYSPTSGNIIIGDVDLNEVNLQLWRDKCGVVMQEGVIFSESIAKNIANSESVDKNRLMFASKTANIYDFISTLPLGFETIVGNDGVMLSNGQKQRILIARAIYKNPDYIFLDEATNSLDSYNERVVVDKLNECFRNKTMIVAAHRLSTIMRADQIVVLDKGKIVEVGNHKSLMLRKGAYYKLVENQLEV